MTEYLLIFRMDILTKEVQPSSEQMKVYMSQWMEWINGIAATKQLAPGGNHLSVAGRVLRPGNAVSGKPYCVNNESVAGYIIILAEDLEAAVKIADKCPILQGEGTSVEIREIETPLEMKPK